MNDSGWVKTHRALLEWEWYKTPNMVHFFLHCLLRANHEYKSWQGKTIKKGEFISGRKKLSLETGLSEQSIRTCINNLKLTNEITIKTTSKYTVFTIISWEKYQDTNNTNQQTNQQATNSQPASNQQPTTNKNEKNYKNEKNNTNKEKPDFEKLRQEFQYLDSETFRKYFEEHLSQKNVSKSLQAIRARLKTLHDVKIEIAIKALIDAIGSGWAGVFPKSERQQNGSPKSFDRQRHEQYAEIEAELARTLDFAKSVETGGDKKRPILRLYSSGNGN